MRKSNRGAIRLYEELLGYKVAGVAPAYYSDGEDAFLMQALLPLEDTLLATEVTRFFWNAYGSRIVGARSVRDAPVSRFFFVLRIREKSRVAMVDEFRYSFDNIPDWLCLRCCLSFSCKPLPAGSGTCCVD